MPSKRKVIISYIIFDLAISIILGSIPSSNITSIIVGSISFTVLGKILHKLYKYSYPPIKEISPVEEPSSSKSQENIISTINNTKSKKLTRILKRKL